MYYVNVQIKAGSPWEGYMQFKNKRKSLLWVEDYMHKFYRVRITTKARPGDYYADGDLR